MLKIYKKYSQLKYQPDIFLARAIKASCGNLPNFIRFFPFFCKDNYSFLFEFKTPLFFNSLDLNAPENTTKMDALPSNCGSVLKILTVSAIKPKKSATVEILQEKENWEKQKKGKKRMKQFEYR